MLVLQYRGTTTIPVEAECLTPDNLAGKSAAEVAALPVQHGNAPAPLGEFFKVSGDASDGEVTLEGDCSRVKWIGAGMKRGTIAVLAPELSLLPTFRHDCDYRPVFLRLYLRQLQQWGFAVRPEHFGGTWRRYSGDLVSLGKGEILHWRADGGQAC